MENDVKKGLVDPKAVVKLDAKSGFWAKKKCSTCWQLVNHLHYLLIVENKNFTRGIKDLERVKHKLITFKAINQFQFR